MIKYPLVDIYHGVPEKRLEQMYLTIAKVALKYGHHARLKPYSRDKLVEFWDDPEIPRPSGSTFFHTIKLPTVKWFIYHKITLEDKIWNADFIHGFARNGKIKWNKKSYPTLHLYNNKSLNELILLSPFGGELNYRRWSYVPALYLKHSEESMSFLAGVLAGGNIVEINGEQFSGHKYWVKPLLTNLGIPIERETAFRTKEVFISPIWAAIMTLWMPEEVREKWTTLSKPFGTDEYCPILWKTYVSSKFPTKGIPYLRSRRHLYYKYQSIESIKRMRVSKGLTTLDNRFREVMHQWGDIAKTKQKER